MRDQPPATVGLELRENRFRSMEKIGCPAGDIGMTQAIFRLLNGSQRCAPALLQRVLSRTAISVELQNLAECRLWTSEAAGGDEKGDDSRVRYRKMHSPRPRERGPYFAMFGLGQQ